jgi:hypothetical protein
MASSASPSGSDKPGASLHVVARLRGHLSLSRVQAIFGLIAALLSIGGSVYYYLGPKKPAPNTGELLAVVEEAKSGQIVPDATVELLTMKDALVTTIKITDGRATRRVKEDTYRLRVSHPRYATEIRPVQIIAGQTAEVRVRLVPRAATAAPPTATDKAVKEGVDALKKILK